MSSWRRRLRNVNVSTRLSPRRSPKSRSNPVLDSIRADLDRVDNEAKENLKASTAEQEKTSQALQLLERHNTELQTSLTGAIAELKLLQGQTATAIAEAATAKAAAAKSDAQAAAAESAAAKAVAEADAAKQLAASAESRAADANATIKQLELERSERELASKAEREADRKAAAVAAATLVTARRTAQAERRSKRERETQEAREARALRRQERAARRATESAEILQRLAAAEAAAQAASAAAVAASSAPRSSIEAGSSEGGAPPRRPSLWEWIGGSDEPTNTRTDKVAGGVGSGESGMISSRRASTEKSEDTLSESESVDTADESQNTDTSDDEEDLAKLDEALRARSVPSSPAHRILGCVHLLALTT